MHAGTSRSEASSALLHTVVCTEDAISGFAVDPRNPLSPLTIEVVFDSTVFARLLCVGLLNVREISIASTTGNDKALVGRLEEKLAGVRVITGGFRYELPAYLPRNRDVHVQVREPASGALLFDAVMRFDGEAVRALGALLDSQPRVKVKPIALTTASLQFLAHSTGPGSPSNPVPRASDPRLPITHQVRRLEKLPDNYYMYRRDVPSWEVSGSVDLRGWDGKPFEIRLHGPDGRALGHYPGALFVPGDCANEYAAWSMPEPKRLIRVMGFNGPLDYYFGGYATYLCVDRALQRATGKPIGQHAAILDWGSGCARLTQHLVRRTGNVVHGIDIDAENVEWSQRNVPKGRFAVTPLLPPAPLPDASFDLITGISVFTHLDRESELAWLAELHRMLRPGGVVVASIKSMYSLYVEAHPVQRYWEMKRRGIDDTAIGYHLDDVLEEGERSYYRETNHAHEYILGTWSRWFDVLGLYVGAHFDYQDFCVLRRREPAGTEVSPL